MALELHNCGATERPSDVIEPREVSSQNTLTDAAGLIEVRSVSAFWEEAREYHSHKRVSSCLWALTGLRAAATERLAGGTILAGLSRLRLAGPVTRTVRQPAGPGLSRPSYQPPLGVRPDSDPREKNTPQADCQ